MLNSLLHRNWREKFKVLIFEHQVKPPEPKTRPTLTREMSLFVGLTVSDKTRRPRVVAAERARFGIIRSEPVLVETLATPPLIFDHQETIRSGGWLLLQQENLLAKRSHPIYVSVFAKQLRTDNRPLLL